MKFNHVYKNEWDVYDDEGYVVATIRRSEFDDSPIFITDKSLDLEEMKEIVKFMETLDA